jgi:hypothetical protein
MIHDQLHLVAVRLYDGVGLLDGGAQGVSERLPEIFVSPAELAVEVVAGVALAALVDAPGSVRLQRGVDHLRHPLIGSRPVAISASEYGVVHAL